MQFSCPACHRSADIAERALHVDRPSRTQCPGCKAWLKLQRTDAGLVAELDATAPQPKNQQFAATLAQPQRFDFDLPQQPPPRPKTGLFRAAPDKPDVGQLVQDFSVMFRADTTKKNRRGKLFGALAALLVLGAVAAVLALQQSQVAVTEVVDSTKAQLGVFHVEAASKDSWVILPLRPGAAPSDRRYSGSALASHGFLTLRKAHMAKIREAQLLQPEPAPLPEAATPAGQVAPVAGKKKRSK